MHAQQSMHRLQVHLHPSLRVSRNLHTGRLLLQKQRENALAHHVSCWPAAISSSVLFFTLNPDNFEISTLTLFGTLM